MSRESLLLASYLLLGPILWIFFGNIIYLGRRKMLLMYRPPHPIKVSPLPSVVIFIPAKDEGDRIRGCLESALGQDYPNVRVVAIDDRSTDQTGAVMDEMAAADPHLSVLHIIEPPPPPWTGKNNALYSAAKEGTGDWLLFVDSDVVLERDALSVAMSVVLRKEFDLLSLLPRLECHTLWESLIVPLAGSAASTLYLVALTNNANWKGRAFANGQFLLIRRSAYDAVGGHATVRDRFCEDVELARVLKDRGFRPRVSWGTDFAAVRMYDSLAAIFRGWSRIFYSARVGNPLTMIIGVLFIFLCCFSGYVALAWGILRMAEWGHGTTPIIWIAAAAMHLGLLMFFVGRMYVWGGNPARNAILFPIAATMLLGIFFRSIWMCVTRKVEWRGTAYSHTMAAELTAAPLSGGPQRK